jgi:hypothetical protein
MSRAVWECRLLQSSSMFDAVHVFNVVLFVLSLG